jgi:benzoyl-CoA reductase subunit A
MTAAIEYWRWPEVSGVEKDIDCKGAAVIAAGVDVGAISSKAAIMCDGKLYAYGVVRTDGDSRGSAHRAMESALKAGKMEPGDIHYIVGTGYGRANVPPAARTVNEVTCHARGAQYLCGPQVRTILDMGGQDYKAIKIDQYGNVVSFIMNDKCATGTGRGIEVFAEMVCIPVTEMGKLSLEVDEDPEPVSSTCITYANSMSLQAMRKMPKNKVLAAHHFSIAWRATILVRRLGLEPELAITGGIAKNEGIVSRIERELGVKALKPKNDPQLAGAIGAAIIGTEAVTSGR